MTVKLEDSMGTGRNRVCDHDPLTFIEPYCTLILDNNFAAVGLHHRGTENLFLNLVNSCALVLCNIHIFIKIQSNLSIKGK